MDDETRKRIASWQAPDLGLGKAVSDVLKGPDMSYMRELEDTLRDQAQLRHYQQETLVNAAEHALEAAATAMSHLASEFGIFEQQLSDQEEMAVFVIGAPDEHAFFPESVRALNPDKILLGGTDSQGRAFTAIQHVSQLNFALKTVTMSEGQEPRRFSKRTS